MDKHLHKDIGEQFSNEINKLKQQPRGHIWENIDKVLDKTDATNYKDKFIRLRKRTLLLLLLLVGISTFSVIYLNTFKPKNNPQYAADYHNSSAQKINGQAEAAKKNNTVTVNDEALTTNNFNQQPVTNIPPAGLVNNHDEDLYFPGKLSIKQNGKTKTKITGAVAMEDESAIVNEIPTADTAVTNKNVQKSMPGAIAKSANVENKPDAVSNKIEKNPLPAVSKSNNKKQINKNLKFTLTAFAAPDYSRYRLVNDKPNSYDDKAGIATRERSDLSSSVGVLLGYKVGNKIIVQSGIIYSTTNISIAATKIYAEKDNAGAVKFRYNTSSGYGYLLPSFSTSPAVGDSLFADGANHTLRYISIPIIAKYKMGSSKLTFNPGIGITINFLTKATLTTDLVDRLNRETEYISKLEGIKKFSAGIILTPELQYQLSKKWSISAMPYFKYSLGPINKGNVVKTYPYTFGLGVGAVYKF